MDVVTSRQNSRVAAAAKLHRSAERRKTGRTLLEGQHLLLSALEAEVDIEVVFALEDDTNSVAAARDYGAQIVAVTPDVMDRLAPTQHPRGPVAVIVIPELQAVRSRETLVLWGVGDPGNAGTIIRSASAFGLDVAAGPETVDLWAPKTLRAGAGAHFATRLSRIADIEELRSAGLAVAATVPRDGAEPDASSTPTAWLIGDEAAGLPEDVVASADRLVSIPMQPGVESLNAAMAAVIIAFVASRPLSRPPDSGTVTGP